METSSPIFKFSTTIHHEMNLFRGIMQTDPNRGKELFAMGSELVTLASTGQHRKFCNLCRSIESEKDIPLIYFISKALEESLLAHHLMISSFVIDNGYPLNDHSLPHIGIAIVKSDKSDEHCCRIIEFLVSKGYDLNGQEPKTWWSALHYAVERGMTQTVQRLIEHKADVNIVADKDLMPLQIAESLSNGSECHTEIRNMLLKSGARDTWRRGLEVSSASVGFAVTENTSIGAKHPSFASVQQQQQQKKQMMSFRGGFNAPLLITPKDTQINPVVVESSVVVSESDDGQAFLFSTGND